ncbi:glycoside hydrolase family 43 protein [uncultured Draconibacterium sp.]|uniref:glycoside hydrolase family 43 protein n=1 Tax=uncultured Draconibacterium sp. TaxID=1573823 RepID=UPI002AA862C6|nr:glycoside hydrolase family 43 protein [uncultured Draconibacterium sp.]
MKNYLIIALVTIVLPVFAQNTHEVLKSNNPYDATIFPNETVTYQNPVIPGFYSDPSICRVGEDYYLVSSTFEYFPGVPIFHSKDLVNWEQIGHCIHRKEQLPDGVNIFAANIRYHEGVFYMITTNVNGFGGKGNFYVTATNPAGPWSYPIWIDQKLQWIDPDFFFDDNGKSYVIASNFELFEIDLVTGKLLTEGRKIWYGTGGRALEGPHIYKKDGFYYLMAAEGGTEEAHSETIARSSSVWGPYVTYKNNPILTHCNQAGQMYEIQGVGHADMLQAHDGSWWMIFHGYRKVDRNAHHILGRETCLTPVTWPKNSWPIVNGNGTVQSNMTCSTLPLKPFRKKSTKTVFDEEKLGLEWNHIQLPVDENYTLSERPGFLRLTGAANIISPIESPIFIGDNGSPTFVARRLQDHNFTATTNLEFNPENENEEAGITLVNNGVSFRLMVEKIGEERYITAKFDFGMITHKSEKKLLKPGPVNLRIQGETTTFAFSFSQGDDDYQTIETINSKFLSSESVGGYTGVYVGLYATGNGKKSKAVADYDWFEYRKDEL